MMLWIAAGGATGGCQLGAASILTIRTAPNLQAPETTFGLREMFWSDPGGKLTVVGRGLAPREHEATACFSCPSQGPHLLRSILVVGDAPDVGGCGQYHVELVLARPLIPGQGEAPPYERVLFVADTPLTGRVFASKRLIDFQGIKLTEKDHPESAIWVTGRLEAKRPEWGELGALEKAHAKAVASTKREGT